jgi:hypothetical protein
MNLVNLEPQQPNNPISVEFNIFKEDLANVLKPNLVLVLVILICIKKHTMLSLIILLSHVVGICQI